MVDIEKKLIACEYCGKAEIENDKASECTECGRLLCPACRVTCDSCAAVFCQDHKGCHDCDTDTDEDIDDDDLDEDFDDDDDFDDEEEEDEEDEEDEGEDEGEEAPIP